MEWFMGKIAVEIHIFLELEANFELFKYYPKY